MSSGRNITKADIKAAFDDTPAAKMHDVILDVNGVSRLFGYSTSTIYEWVKKGRFDGCYRKRGKGMRFWRDKVIDRFFNGPDWSSQNEN